MTMRMRKKECVRGEKERERNKSCGETCPLTCSALLLCSIHISPEHAAHSLPLINLTLSETYRLLLWLFLIGPDMLNLPKISSPSTSIHMHLNSSSSGCAQHSHSHKHRHTGTHLFFYKHISLLIWRTQ